MKAFTLNRFLMLLTVIFVTFSGFAQEKSKFELTPAADLVSSYVWRGVYQTSTSVQPSLKASYAGLSLTAWGSTDFNTTAKEFDLTLGYTTGGLTLAATDYWWAGEGNRYGNYSAYHFFEGTVGYNFGESLPLYINWNTIFGMDGDKNADGDQQYSTFVEAGYGFKVSDVDVTASIGVSPWTGMYHREGTDGFALSTISVKASKSIKFTESFSLPVFAQAIVAPNRDNVFLVFGLSL